MPEKAEPLRYYEAIMKPWLEGPSARKCGFYEGDWILREDDLFGILPPKCKNSLGIRYS